MNKSWLTVNDVNLHIPGYKFYNFPCPSHGGGIVMYIKCNIEVIEYNFNSSHHSFEVSLLQLHVHGCNSKISFIGIFRPPSTSKDNFLLELEQLMQTISHNLSDSIIVSGDLNIDISLNNQFSFNLINLFLYFKCFSTLYIPTQAIMKNTSLLDHIFVNAPKFFYSGIIAKKFSDHLPVFTIIELTQINTIINKHIISSVQHVSREGVNLARQYLAKINWSFITESSDIESAYNTFSEKLVNVFDHRIPVKYMNIEINPKDSNKWITQGIHKSYKQKVKLYKKVLKGTVLMADYLQYRNRLSLIIISAIKLIILNVQIITLKILKLHGMLSMNYWEK